MRWAAGRDRWRVEDDVVFRVLDAAGLRKVLDDDGLEGRLAVDELNERHVAELGQ